MLADPQSKVLQAVLFDMDGLLVDSEPEWFEVEAAVFERLGATRAWTAADAHALVGTALVVSAARIAREAGSSVPPAVITDWLVDAMAQRFSRGVPWKPGAVQLMAELATDGVGVGVVSSSYRRLVDTVLAQLPAGIVGTSVAGDEVTRGKPHPEPYLHALDRLGLPPDGVVVLEDSPTGAAAGAAAGCTVVVVPDLAPLPATHSWRVADSLAALSPAGLASLLGRDRR